jgi:SAM-dependent methyltransferase
MLNWLARYAPLRELLLDDNGTPRSSILDVGCGPHGLACAFPEVPFVGTDVLFPHAVAPSMRGVRTVAGPLPFADASFGTVLSLDTLEHIPRPDRADFVAELARVSADRVVVACPSSEAQASDDFFRNLMGEPPPIWLAEHYEMGLPTPEEIAACMKAVDGFRARELQTTNGLLAVLLAFGDIVPTYAGIAAAEFQRNHAEWMRVCEGATFGSSWRKIWLLERVEVRNPIIAPHAPARDVAAALRCPACGSAHRDLVCVGCDRVVTVDAAGAWDAATIERALVTGPVADLQSEAAVIMRYLPQPGEREVLATVLRTYIQRTASTDDICLAIDASRNPAFAGVVGELCDGFAADKPDFGDIVLLTEPIRWSADVQLVRDSEDVLNVLDAVPAA